jgi:hypothetical protein
VSEIEKDEVEAHKHMKRNDDGQADDNDVEAHKHMK